MKHVFAGAFLLPLGLSTVAVYLKSAQVHNDRLVLSCSCVEFWVYVVKHLGHSG